MTEDEIVRLAMVAVREVVDREVAGAIVVSVPEYADGYLLDGVREFVGCVLDSVAEVAMAD
jgi:hypothetical protein